jgi:type VI secretion system protein ImpH
MAGEIRAAADPLDAEAIEAGRSGDNLAEAGAEADAGGEAEAGASPVLPMPAPSPLLPLTPAPATAPAVPTGPSRIPPLDPRRADAAALIIDLLSRAPGQFDFFQVMRRLESLTCDRPERPLFGSALRPVDEPIRLGQEPTMAFPPNALSGVEPGRNGVPPRLAVNFFGLLGPNGALPLHLTEYVRDRVRNAADPTMSRFLDVFHHRMLMFFYRAWASAEPTASHDRPETDRFLTYVGSLLGLGQPSVRGRDELPDDAKLFYAGRFSVHARNAEGLAAVIGDFFQMPTRVEQFVGDWLDLPVEHQWHLGQPGGLGLLGMSTTLGSHAWSRQQKFRVVMGPLERVQFQRMLPGGPSLARLAALVRNYIGDELRWDLRLFLEERVDQPWRFGESRLGWTSWLGRPGWGRAQREDLILDPQWENRWAT